MVAEAVVQVQVVQVVVAVVVAMVAVVAAALASEREAVVVVGILRPLWLAGGHPRRVP